MKLRGPGLWASLVLATCSPSSALRLRLRRAASSCQLPDGAVWCSVHLPGLPSFQLAAYSNSDIVSNSLCHSGNWEGFDPKSMGKPGTAVDIGGNIGFYSLSLAQAGWEVLTFEPVDKNVQLIQASLCANPALAARVRLHAVGLGAQDAKCEMYSDIYNKGDGVTRCDGSSPGAQYTSLGSFAIRRLDDILAEENVTVVNFAKLDIEGYECKAMEGGRSLLTKYRPESIQTEVSPQMMVGCSVTDYLDLYRRASYVVAVDRHCDHPTSTSPHSTMDYFMCAQAVSTNTSLVAEGSQHMRRILTLKRQ